jgi:hypothetical protein
MLLAYSGRESARNRDANYTEQQTYTYIYATRERTCFGRTDQYDRCYISPQQISKLLSSFLPHWWHIILEVV